MTSWKLEFTAWSGRPRGPARMNRRSNAGGILSTGCQGRDAHHFGGALKLSGDHRLAASRGAGDEHSVICELEHVHGDDAHDANSGERRLRLDPASAPEPRIPPNDAPAECRGGFVHGLDPTRTGPGRHRAGLGEGYLRREVSAIRLRRQDKQGSYGRRDPEVDGADQRRGCCWT